MCLSYYYQPISCDRNSGRRPEIHRPPAKFHYTSHGRLYSPRSILVTGQKLPDNKPPRIIEEIIAKCAVDANLFGLGYTNPKKNPCFFFAFYTGGFFPGTFCKGGFDLKPLS